MNKSSSPKRANEIALLIENEVLLPMGTAVDTFGWLEELGKTVREVADAPIKARGDHQAVRNALIRVSGLAEVISYLASDFGNYLDCMREHIETEHKAVITDAVKEGSHE